MRGGRQPPRSLPGDRLRTPYLAPSAIIAAVTSMTAEDVLAAIPEHLRESQGVVLYTGGNAWLREPGDRPPFYFLGHNPGGIQEQHDSIVYTQAAHRLTTPEYSSYDEHREPWRKSNGHRNPMGQRRVTGLFEGLGQKPTLVPASNVVFARSRDITALSRGFEYEAQDCWSFHASMIEALRPKFIVCSGPVGADFVARMNPGPTVVGLPHFSQRGPTAPAWIADALAIAKPIIDGAT